LKNDDLAEPDMLGRAYEYLISQFADDAGKKGGEFYTPRLVVRLIVEMLQPTEGMRICDPTVGSGGLLLVEHQRAAFSLPVVVAPFGILLPTLSHRAIHARRSPRLKP